VLLIIGIIPVQWKKANCPDDGTLIFADLRQCTIDAQKVIMAGEHRHRKRKLQALTYDRLLPVHAANV
jgi:hypothetical protein